MKTILLHIHADERQDARVDCAIGLARLWKGQIECLQATPLDSYIGGDSFGGVYLYDDLLASVREQEQSERKRIEAWLDDSAVGYRWTHVDGNVAGSLVSASILSDMIVLSQPAPRRDDHVPPLVLIAEVAVHARTLVCALPFEGRKFDAAGRALVAWNNSPEAAHALRAALPVLRKAVSVDVLEITDDKTDAGESAATHYLTLHGVNATLHRERYSGLTGAQALLDGAAQLDAGYIVMGAYGHSRLLELIVGGVTRDLSGGCAWPLLLAH